MKLSEVRPEELHDTRDLSLSVNIVGISAEFILPTPHVDPTSQKVLDPPTRPQLLCITGGIGTTHPVPFQIDFVVSTRYLGAPCPLFPVPGRCQKGSCGPLRISSFIYLRTRRWYQFVLALSTRLIVVGYQPRSSSKRKNFFLGRVWGSTFAVLGILKALLLMHCHCEG